MLNKNLLFAVLITAYSMHLFASVEELTTKDKFNQKVLNAPGLVIVKASATWCGPCKQLAPHFKEISEEHKDIAFYEVDDKNNQLIREFGVAGYPTVLFFIDGKKIDSTIGSVPDLIRSKINQHKSRANGAKRAVTKAAPAPMPEEMEEEVAPRPVVVRQAPVIKPAPVRTVRTERASHRSRSRRGSCTSCR